MRIDTRKKRKLTSGCAKLDILVDQKPSVAVFNDLSFPKLCKGADYDTIWRRDLTSSEVYKITACQESAVIFAAREGWVKSTSPICLKPKCFKKQRGSHLYKRKQEGQCWRFKCCRGLITILKDSMFYNSSYGPGKIIERFQ